MGVKTRKSVQGRCRRRLFDDFDRRGMGIETAWRSGTVRALKLLRLQKALGSKGNFDRTRYAGNETYL
jgi:hypothetical protein